MQWHVWKFKKDINFGTRFFLCRIFIQQTSRCTVTRRGIWQYNQFQALLEENPAKHPIIILKDVPFQHLTAILEFMYAGEVNVAQDQLPVSDRPYLITTIEVKKRTLNVQSLAIDKAHYSQVTENFIIWITWTSQAFLKTAERLKVKGLAEAPQTIKQEWVRKWEVKQISTVNLNNTSLDRTPNQDRSTCPSQVYFLRAFGYF